MIKHMKNVTEDLEEEHEDVEEEIALLLLHDEAC